jgi:Protein of unknown function (DUF664)
MGKEIQGYLEAMGEMREEIVKLLEGLPEEALDWKPIQGEGELATNSLAAMATHVAGSATYLIKEVVGGQSMQRNRQAEFESRGVSVSALKARLDGAVKTMEETLASLNDQQLDDDRKYRDRTAKIRWIVLHVIEHTAQHVGHMQLTRQLWQAQNRK